MLLRSFKVDKKGNVSILALVLVIFLAFLFLLVFDLCRILVAREMAKKASDAASLAAAQNLIFFENVNLKKVANKMAKENNCDLVECYWDYDQVTVIVEKKLNFVLIDKLTPKYSRVQSASTVKVIYPWDSQFGFCKSYKFSY